MANAHDIQTSFTGGELSPLLAGRVDIAAYKVGCQTLRNFQLLSFGGARRRRGTSFRAATKDSATASRLVPFVYSQTQAYVLEFGDQYIRVYKDGAQVGPGYEIASPFTAAQLFELDYSQSADTMIITHRSHYPRRLRRFGDALWVLDQVPFLVLPFDEVGLRAQTTLAIDNPAVGAGRTFTAGAAIFQAADVGREVQAGTGLATITAVASSTVATARIDAAFDAAAYAAQGWQLLGSPQATCTASGTGPVGETLDLSLGSASLEAAKAITGLAWSAGVVTVTVAAHGYSTGDTVAIAGASPAGYSGSYAITVGADPDTFTYALGANPGLATVLGTAARSASSTSNGWRPGDVGSWVRINGGLCEITEYVSATLVRARVVAVLASDVAAPANSWSLESAIWSDQDGWPMCSTFHEQRLLFGGAPGNPQQIAFSQSGAYFDFTPGTLDTDALVRAIATDEQNPIEYLAADTVLLAMTYGGEFTVRGGLEKPITPTNIQVKPKTNYGAARVRPVKVQKERVFAQRSGTQLVAIQYAEENDTFNAEDISILSEHLFAEGIVEIAYQRRPVPSLYCVLESGELAVGTIDRNQNILGWAPWETEGVVESVCAIPRGKADEVWVVVRRTVNGATVRYVERFEETFEALYGQTGYPYGYTVDCAIEQANAVPFTAVTGLDHLEGEAVSVLADGYNGGTYTVAAGAITLATAAKNVLVGLAFSAVLEPMPPEMPTAAGSARGRPVRATEATVLVHRSLGGRINGVPLPARSFGEGVLDAPPPLFTGERRVDGLSGWERGQPLVRVEQDEPLPMHVLAVIQKLVVNP